MLFRSKLGLYITNGELRDKTFSCSIRYTVIDLKNNKLSFNILTDKVEEFIFDIMHTLSYGTAKNKILEINKLLSISESMIHHIKDLSDANKLDGDTLFQLFTNITKDRTGTISSESKKNFQELYDKNLTSNSYSIIEAFNLIGKMFTKIDEKLFLEKTYYEVLKALSKK